MQSLTLNFPTILTLSRLILSPLIMPLLLIWGLPLNLVHLNGMLALIFVFFSLTDFFDGYLARHYGQETALGRLLDPIADKFLVYSTLIALVATHKLFFFWTIIIVGREFLVTSLREIALHYDFSLPVSSIGKLKTVTQMIFVTFVILNPAQEQGLKAPVWNGVETFLLISTLILTIASAFVYAKQFMYSWEKRTLKNDFYG